jgi:cell division protein FtsB
MAEESHFRLRIPADLKAKLEAAAKESGRSMNAQVLYTLQLALSQEDEIEKLRQSNDDLEDRVRDLERDVGRLIDATGIGY